MKNLNEEINRFRQLLSAQHGVIKPYKKINEGLEYFDNEINTNKRKELFFEEEISTPPPVKVAPVTPTAPVTGATPAQVAAPTPAQPATQQTVGTAPSPKTAVGSGPAPAPSTGSTAPQPAQPTEAEFYEEEDFDDFEDDNEDEMWEIDQMLQDAIEEGRDILEYEADMTNDELNELSELDIAEELRELRYDDLADSIEEMYDMVFNK